MRVFFAFLIYSLAIWAEGSALEIVVHVPGGGSVLVDVPPEQTIGEIHEGLGWLFFDEGELLPDLRVEEVMFTDRLSNSNDLPPSPPGARNYSLPLSDQEIHDITYIVTVLANKPLAKLLFYKSSLDRAGSRIDHVHPFRFLECIFTDEGMKVGIRNIHKKGWVWRDFLGGLKGSMADEYHRQNLFPYVDDFARNVGVDPEIIIPAVNNLQVEELVLLLIEHVPRHGDHNRYNM